MKIYEVVGQERYFTTLEKAQQYILNLAPIKKVAVGKHYDKEVYTKKFYPLGCDYTHYVFYDCLEAGMSYTDWLIKNKCLECGTIIYFNDIPPVEIKTIEVE